MQAPRIIEKSTPVDAAGAISQPTVGVICITHAAVRHLAHCLPVFLQSSLRPRVLVVNSSSNDGTVEEARRLGAEVLLIPRAEFNHGATRERARRQLGTDIVVMITPDAYATDARFLEKLVAPLLSGEADVSYARQLPRDGAKVLESFPRFYNYPPQSHIRSLGDISRYGVFTFFCSNSCAAWRNEKLDEIGGFEPILTNEDYFAVARILKAGGRIAYVAEAEIQHSHEYTLWQEFQRYFDTGYVRAQHKEITEMVGRAEKRGMGLFQALIRKLARTQPSLIPYAILQSIAKWVGYRVGYLSFRAPMWWNRRLSAQEYYWSSIFKTQNSKSRG
jgi:rhamnosyltransferase